jgi:sulfate adenylyltransferase subunit 1 (EFTu-like GTPase family)
MYRRSCQRTGETRVPARRGYRTIRVELKKQVIVPVRASPKVADALQELSADMDLYQGIKLRQILEAVYEQGRKDGRREVFEVVDEAKKGLPHRPPGRPRTRR